jgi:hypothetical protein
MEKAEDGIQKTDDRRLETPPGVLRTFFRKKTLLKIFNCQLSIVNEFLGRV